LTIYSTVILIFFAYLVLVNFGAYRQFARDKQASIDEEWRTPEDTLLWWARIGGWGGAKLAQHKLNHKTTKQPFGSKLNLIGMVHAMTLTAVALTISFFALEPLAKPATTPDRIAVQDSQPAGAPPVISLRPPAAYRATQ